VNRRPDLPQVLVSVDLAREPDFTLGSLRVCPSCRQVIAPDRQETVQPRVMQALVALARAGGAVVSREELIETCWEGIVVGDDAINRCIAKVRQIAKLGGGIAFEIETIPRVGYRLTRNEALQGEAVELRPSVAMTAAASNVKRLSARRPVQWWPVGVLAFPLLLAALVALWLFRPSPPAQWVVTRTELPIATALMERHPAISPDGAMIAYSAGADVFSRRIYLKRIEGGGDPLPLTNDGFDDASPTWSPDGRQIAYVAYKRGEPCRLMVVPVPAGPPHELTRCRSDDRSSVVWSISGTELFFVDRADRKSPDRIMRFDLESGQRAQLTHPPKDGLDEEGPTASPDGRWIAFLRHASDAQAPRMLFDLSSGTERTLIRNDYGLGSEAWSNDSGTVFTIDSQETEFQIWAHPVNGGAPQRIFSTPEEITRLNSGPNGLLAVEINRLMTGLARSPVQGGDRPRFFESENGSAFTPDVAGDGSIVAALTRPDGAGLWLFPVTGPAREVAPIDRGLAEIATPRWSPDGRQIAFVLPGSSFVGLRVIASTGAPVAAIAFPGKTICSPAWSPDGRSLIFAGRDDGGWRLWQVDIAKPNRLVPLPQRGWVSVRRDGNALYGVAEGAPGVWRIDGKPRQIVKEALLKPDQWTIVGHSIAWLDYGKQRLIRIQPLDGGPAHILAQVPEYAGSFGFAIDPLSGSVIYVARLALDAGDIELLHLARQ
jgi:Tol biopolymer transport system component/DNA-binding winged helix-turn-helix (wHTH) protein